MPLANAPKILRGAFVEFGLSIPPLFVVFQFNPVELSRNRSLSFAPENALCRPMPMGPNAGQGGAQIPMNYCMPQTKTLREWHGKVDDLLEIQKRQKVTIQEESISLDIRLDATDKMEQGDPIAATFGVLPQLSTLELMVHPKSESILGGLVDDLIPSDKKGFSFTDEPRPPMILFIWGHKRVLPVNITSMNIKETEFSTLLDPIRATVSVSLSVIEGKNALFMYSKIAKEVSSVLNLANIADIANVVIPG